jgi:tetratricopeptide (TPR) repeat protein
VRQLIDITEHPQLLLANADVLVIAKRFDEAEKLVQQMKVPAHQSVVRGRIELERGNPATALKMFDEGMRVWPNNAETRYYAAIAAEQLGDFGRAIEEYRYAMRIDVTATDAYLRQARLHSAAGHDEIALDTLEFEPGGRPEEVAAGLLEMRIRGRLGEERGAPPWVRAMLGRPEHWGAAVAALGEGVRERSGPKAALEAMKGVKPLDLHNPLHVEALAAIVEDLAATGKPKEGLALVDAGLREHPDAAAFLAVRGRALELSGAPAAAVREAFERALALDAKNARALVGLARITAAAGSKEAALALYDRALAADVNDRTAARAAASLLVGLGRSGEAEERLAALLREHPYDADAARDLAELRLGRGARDERTIELAKRAVAFGGGAEAKALLERVEPRAEPAAAPTS